MSFQQARKNMVDCQLKPNHITNEAVLEAFYQMPREAFLPDHLKDFSYLDEEFKLMENRYATDPSILAHMVQIADIQEDEIALVIGAGDGYFSALLAQFASTVVALEESEELISLMQAGLEETDVQNVVPVMGNLADGYAAQAPYDVIFINGAVAEFPHHIAQQLSEGGRFLFVEKKNEKTGMLTCVTMKDGVTVVEHLGNAQMPYLPGFEPKVTFNL